MIRSVISRLDGYRRRGIHEWSMMRHRALERRKRTIFDQWIRQLKDHPPQVLIGPNFARFGGVRHHIEAICRYSSLHVELVPPAEVTTTLTPFDLTHLLSEEFMSYRAPGVGVVHSHVYPWYIDWCRQRQQDGIFWIHTYHLNYYPEHAAAELEPWQAEINEALLNRARHADLCLSVSKWQVDELRQAHGIEATYMPNCVDVSLCDRADPERFRRKYQLSDFVLYVGRNDPVKNPAEFVALARALPDHTFVMVGGGLTDEAFRCMHEAPKNLAVFGELSQREVQDAIAACRVLVVTSKREGLPTLVMEGMALRRPVVVPTEAGCMEAIGNGEAGYIYRLGDIESLVEMTLTAMEDSQVGTIARNRVIAEFDWRVVAQKLDRIYQG